MDLLRLIQNEWRVIRSAPLTILALLTASAGVLWWVMEWRYADRIDTANQTIKLMETKLSAGSPESAITKIDELQEELRKLRAEANASVSFSSPIIFQTNEGTYRVRSKMHINATVPRTGLTIGITTERFAGFRLLGAIGAITLHGQYTHPTAWTSLGTSTSF